MADNYVAVATALGLSHQELVRCARNSLAACVAPEARRQAWLAELDAYPDPVLMPLRSLRRTVMA